MSFHGSKYGSKRMDCFGQSNHHMCLRSHHSATALQAAKPHFVPDHFRRSISITQIHHCACMAKASRRWPQPCALGPAAPRIAGPRAMITNLKTGGSGEQVMANCCRCRYFDTGKCPVGLSLVRAAANCRISRRAMKRYC